MAGPRKRATITKMLAEDKRMRTLGQTTQQTGFVSPLVPYTPPVDPWVDPLPHLAASQQTGERSGPAYYFCLECNTVEVYHVVPQIQGQPGVPWHTHGSGQVLLHALTPDVAKRFMRSQNFRVTHHDRIHDGRQPVQEGMPATAPLGGKRLEAVMAAIEERGW